MAPTLFFSITSHVLCLAERQEKTMPEITHSYVHGASATPLIGDTIGVHFDKAAAVSYTHLTLPTKRIV